MEFGSRPSLAVESTVDQNPAKSSIPMSPSLVARHLTRWFKLPVFLVCAVPSAPALSASLDEAQQLLRRGQFQQALDQADGVISGQPKDVQARFLKGLILAEMNRVPDALSVFTKLTEDYPELPEPYNNLAVLYAQQKQYEKSRTALEMAIRTHPSYAIAHENLGDVYAKLASQAYNKALQLDSSNSTAQTKLALIRDLISVSSKPGSHPSAALPTREPTRVTAGDMSPKGAVPPIPADKPAAPISKTDTAPNARTTLPSPEGIDRTVRDWAAAWARKDVSAYLGYYADDFETPKGVQREQWAAERARRIEQPESIDIKIERLRVEVQSPDRATVKFRQHYRSNQFSSSTNKTLGMHRIGNRWLIQREQAG